MKIRNKIARWLAPELFREVERKEKEIGLMVNQRVAETMSRLDPFEPLMKQFHGVFSEELEKPEEKLDRRSWLGLVMWAWQQEKDPSFKFLTEWIMNTQGNETLKRAAVTTDRILYGRAQISTMLLLKKEIGRLSSLYEEELLKNRPQPDIDEGVAVEA